MTNREAWVRFACAALSQVYGELTPKAAAEAAQRAADLMMEKLCERDALHASDEEYWWGP